MGIGSEKRDYQSNRDPRNGFDRYTDDWENHRRRQFSGERGEPLYSIVDEKPVKLAAKAKYELKNVEHFTDMKENMQESIRQDERQMEFLRNNLTRRLEALLKVEAKIHEHTVKANELKEKLAQWREKQKSLELEIEFLQEDPGNDESIQLLKKELEELINKL